MTFLPTQVLPLLWNHLPPPKHISLSSISSLDVSRTNSSKQGSAAGWKVLRDSVAFWILKHNRKRKETIIIKVRFLIIDFCKDTKQQHYSQQTECLHCPNVFSISPVLWGHLAIFNTVSHKHNEGLKAESLSRVNWTNHPIMTVREKGSSLQKLLKEIN